MSTNKPDRDKPTQPTQPRPQPRPEPGNPKPVPQDDPTNPGGGVPEGPGKKP